MVTCLAMTLLESPSAVGILSVLVGITLIVSGLGKFMDLRRFQATVANYGAGLAPISRVLSLILPIIEVLLGCVLISGLVRLPAAAALLIILGSFLILQVANLIRRRSVECGCFGSLAHEKISSITISRTAVLLLVAAYLLIYGSAAPAGNSFVLPWVLVILGAVSVLIALIYSRVLVRSVYPFFSYSPSALNGSRKR